MSTRPSPARGAVTAGTLSAVLAAGSLVAPASVAAAVPAGTAVRAEVLVATLVSSGDPNGSGSATIRLKPARKRVCATLTWRRIKTPVAAHIHRVSDGSIAVDLTSAVPDGTGCARGVPRSTIRAILDRPRRYYVNVHNAPYPAGAVQGTLHR